MEYMDLLVRGGARLLMVRGYRREKWSPSPAEELVIIFFLILFLSDDVAYSPKHLHA